MGFLALGLAAIAKRLLVLITFGVVVASLGWAVSATYRKDAFLGVNIIGIHHLGPDFNVDRFYVDGYNASNVGRSGGGDGSVCCVLLPKKWRPGLSVDLRWSIGNWSKENLAETEVGNYRSLSSAGAYRARVPVEKYDEVGDLYVHFFPNGKAKVVSSLSGRRSTEHPVQDNDPHAVDGATTGIPVDELFTPTEVEEVARKAAEDKRKHGDWR